MEAHGPVQNATEYFPKSGNPTLDWGFPAGFRGLFVLALSVPLTEGKARSLRVPYYVSATPKSEARVPLCTTGLCLCLHNQ
jgi:hypothetical protein